MVAADDRIGESVPSVTLSRLKLPAVALAGLFVAGACLSDPAATPEAWKRYRFQVAINAAMTGRKAPPAVKAGKAYVPKRRKKRKGGCS